MLRDVQDCKVIPGPFLSISAQFRIVKLFLDRSFSFAARPYEISRTAFSFTGLTPAACSALEQGQYAAMRHQKGQHNLLHPLNLPHIFPHNFIKQP